MPANLPPEYFEAERRFKEAKTPLEKTSALEALIATVPKHKGTDKLRADLRRRLSRLREEAVRQKRSGRVDLLTVEREGALRAALVGLPNSGKSSILASLTNANPVIAAYPVSTVMPLSGMMPFEDIQFQLVDLPPVGNESTDGWLSGILRNADMLILVVDLSDDPDIQAGLLLEQLRQWNISLCRNENINEPKTECKKVIIAANKADIPGAGNALTALIRQYGGLYPVINISTTTKSGLEELKRSVFENSGIIRIYTKEPGNDPDLNTPFTVPYGSTLIDLAELIHKDFVKNLSYACIWGSSRFPGQRVQKEYILQDRDIVEFHIR